MKVFRDMFAAILLGLIGGMLVATFSYYRNHKEGGVKETLAAVTDSFDRVAAAYSGGNGSLKKYDLSDEVLDAFSRIEDGDEEFLQSTLIETIAKADDLIEDDILAMDGLVEMAEDVQPYSGIIRFHVRANSDSAKDQALKIKVKDELINVIKPLTEDCKDAKETKNVIIANMDKIYDTACDVIEEQGYEYDVKVYVTEEQFPAKTYGDLTFPEGKYQALRVDIGKAQGKNWWCVVFPPLCFVDESTAVVSSDSKEKLKEALTPEEYAELFAYAGKGVTPDGEAVEIKGESLIYNWIKEKMKD